jgi:hypothetical protein
LIETADELIPIEVKLSKRPASRDAKPLLTFMREYPKAKRAFVVAQSDNPIQLEKTIQAIPWDIFLLKSWIRSCNT